MEIVKHNFRFLSRFPLLIILLLATPLLISARTVDSFDCTSDCPDQCECVYDETYGGCAVDCSGSSLESIPSIYPDFTVSLSLDGCNITKIEADDFSKLTNLSNLNLAACGLETIAEGAFDPLISITYLDITDNDLLCDCNLLWLKTWLSTDVVEVEGIESLACSSPSELANYPLTILPDAAYICLDNVISCRTNNGEYEVLQYSQIYYSYSYTLQEEHCYAYCADTGYQYGSLRDTNICICGDLDSSSSYSACCEKSCDLELATNFNSTPPQSEIKINTNSPILRDGALTFSLPTAGSQEVDFGDGSPATTLSSEDSNTYKYAGPGSYRIFATLYDTRGGITSVATSLVEVFERAYIELSCDTTLEYEPLDLYVYIYTGWDLDFTWYTSDKLLEDGAYSSSDGAVTYVAGIPISPASLDVTDVSTSSSESSATFVGILPGMWFQHSGTLRSWELVGDPDETTQFWFQVYRPSCDSGYTLISPGCDDFYIPYHSCLNDSLRASSCDIDVTCSHGRQYCPFTKSCLQLSEYCFTFYNDTLSDSSGGKIPNYELVGETYVELSPSEAVDGVWYIVSADIDVEPNDLIGFQSNETAFFNASAVGGLASDSDLDYSKWYSEVRVTNSAIKMETGSVISESEWSADLDSGLFFIRALYYDTDTHYPSSGDVFDEGLTVYSEQSFTVSTNNSLSTSSDTCTIYVVTTVSEPEWISPSTSTDATTGDITVTVGQDADVTFVLGIVDWLVSVSWTVTDSDTGEDYSSSSGEFDSACPDDVADYVMCDEWVTSFTDPGTYTLSYEVSNGPTSTDGSILLIVVATITGLECASSSDVAYVDEDVTFTASTNSTDDITYTWIIGNTVTGDDASSLTTSFDVASTQTLVIEASNIAGTQSANCTVRVIIESILSLSWEDIVSSSATNEIVTFKLAIELDSLYREDSTGPSPYFLYIDWNFGDGEVTSEEISVSAIVILHTLTHNYTTPYQYYYPDVNVSYSDDSKQLSYSELLVQDGITMVEIVDCDLYEFVPTETVLALQINVTGGDDTTNFTWYIDDALYIETDMTSYTCEFLIPGTYVIKVIASNAVSEDVETTCSITAEEYVEGVELRVSGTLGANTNITITAFSDKGSDLWYSFDFGDGEILESTQNSSVVKVYASADYFTITVEVFNTISSNTTSLTIEVLNLIVVVGLTMDDCYVVGDVANVSVVLEGGVSGVVVYSWTFGDSPGVNTTESYVVESDLDVVGYTDVCVVLFGSDSATDQTFCDTICVQDGIESFQVSATESEVATGDPVEFVPVVDGGFDSTLYWEFGDGSTTNSSNTSATYHTFETAGIYTVEVTASNMVNSATAHVTIVTQDPISDLSVDCLSDECYDNYFLTDENHVLEVTSSGTNVTYVLRELWGEADTTAGDTVTISISSPGSYYLNVSASNLVSSTYSLLELVFVDAVTISSFTADNQSIYMNQEVTFQVTLPDPDQPVLEYTWYFCDGCDGVTGDDDTVTHSYADTGTYNITVVVDVGFGTANASLSVEVGTDEKIYSISIYYYPASSNHISVNDTVYFSIVDYTGTNVEFEWTVDDGNLTSLTGENVSHTFLTVGTVTVLVAATNSRNTFTIAVELYIEQEIKNFTVVVANPDFLFVGSIVVFGVKNLDSVKPYFDWDFGTGSAAVSSDQPVMSTIFYEAGTFNVSVEVTNYISTVTKVIEVTVELMNCTAPTLSMIGDSARYLYPYFDLFVEVAVDIRGCTAYDTAYTWYVYNDVTCSESGTDDPALQSDDMGSSLYLEGYTFTVGDHCAKLIAEFTGTAYSSTIEVDVTVLSADLVPIVSGGTSRQVYTDDKLTLDGSESYDANTINCTNYDITYEWECFTEDDWRTQEVCDDSDTSTDSPNCVSEDYLPETSANEQCQMITGSNLSVLTIDASELDTDILYMVYLHISKTDYSTMTTMQEITVTETTIPAVTLTCISCLDYHHWMVGSQNRVTITSSVSGYTVTDPSLQFEWTVSDNTVLDDTTTTTGGSSYNLNIVPGVLTDGVDLTFSLSVSSTDHDASAIVTYTLTANVAPYDGSCAIVPSSGYAVDSLFMYSCYNWTNDVSTFPLTYSVSVSWLDSSTGETVEYLVYEGAADSNIFFLPAGASDSKYAVTATITVSDVYGAATLALSTSLKVTYDTDESLSVLLGDHISTNLPFITSLGNTQRTQNFILAIISVMNQDWEDDDDYEFRSTARLTLMEAVQSLPVMKYSSVAQMATVLYELSAVSAEFDATDCIETSLQIVGDLIDYIENSIQSDDEIGQKLIMVLSNLLSSAESSLTSMTDTVQDVFTAAFDLVKSVALTLLATKLPDELALEITSNYVTMVAERRYAEKLNSSLEVNSACFELPADLFESVGNSTELFQVFVQSSYNPFSWGVLGPYELNTHTSTLYYTYANASEFDVTGLSNTSLIDITLLSTIYEGHVTDDPVDYLDHVTGMVEPGDSAFYEIDLSGSINKSIVHCIVSVQAVGVAGTLDAYLGLTADVSETNFDKMTTVEVNETGQATFILESGEFTSSPTVYIVVYNSQATSVNISLVSYQTSCQYYNETLSAWDTEGCLPSYNSTPAQVVCQCNHLTTFAAYSIDISDSVLYKAVMPTSTSVNVVMISVLATLSVLFVIMLIVGRRVDVIHRAIGGCVPLCGKNGSFKYQITVQTGMKPFAGTTAHVGIQIHGAKAKSNRQHLYREKAFTRNNKDVFVIATELDLGDITRVHVWHDNTGRSPAWFLSYVSVKDLQTRSNYNFLFDCWFALRSYSRGIERKINVASLEELSSFSLIFPNGFITALSNIHVWLSVFDKPFISSTTAIMRIVRCFTLIYTILALLVAWYGILGNSEHDTVFSYSTLYVGCAVCMGATVICMVINCIFCFCAPNITDTDMNKPPTAVSVEVEGLENSNKTNGSSILTNATKRMLLGPRNVRVSDTTTTTTTDPEKPARVDFVDTEPEPKQGPSTARKLRRQSSVIAQEFCIKQKHAGHLWSHDNILRWSADDKGKKKGGGGGAGKKVVKKTPGDVRKCVSVAPGNEGLLIADFATVNEATLTEAHESCELSRPVKPVPMNRTMLKRCSNITRDTNVKRMSIHSSTSLRPGNQRAKHICLIVAYLLASVIVTVASVLIVIYSNEMSYTTTLLWAASATVAVTFSVVVLEPLKVVFYALVMALSRRTLDDCGDTDIEFVVIETHERVRDVSVRPVAGFALKQAQAEGRKLDALYSVMKKTTIYTAFLSLVFLLTFLNYNTSSYLTQRNLVETLVNPTYTHYNSEESFITMSRRDSFYDWAVNVMLPGLYNTSGRPDWHEYILRFPRLRQIRYTNETCPSLSFDEYQCRTTTEDHSDYGIGWALGSSWLYSAASHRLPTWGFLGSYDLGGYVQSLPLNYTDAAALLTNLSSLSWLDSKTAAVFVELTTYNPNVQLFTSISLLAEVSSAGSVRTSYNFNHFSSLICSIEFDWIMVVYCLLILLLIAIVVSETTLTHGDNRTPHCLTRPSTFVHALLVILTLSSVALYALMLALSSDQCLTYVNNTELFIDTSVTASIHYWWQCVHAIIITMMFMKIVRLLMFSQTLAIYWYTLQHTAVFILAATTLIIAIMFVYAQFGYLVFSSSLPEFRSVWSSFITLCALLRADVSFPSSYPEVHRFLLPVYYSTFILAVIFTQCKLYAAIMISSLREVKLVISRTVALSEAHQLIEFMLKQLKQWIGLEKPRQFRHRVKFQGLQSTSSGSHSSSLPGSFTEGAEDSNMNDDMTYNISVLMAKIAPTLDITLHSLDNIIGDLKEEDRIDKELTRLVKLGQRKDVQEKASDSSQLMKHLPQLMRKKIVRRQDSMQSQLSSLSSRRMSGDIPRYMLTTVSFQGKTVDAATADKPPP